MFSKYFYDKWPFPLINEFIMATMASKSNKFSNPNVDKWWKWVFRRSDSLPSVSIYFLSKRYSTSPRFFPLYNESRNIRIVLFQGSRIPGIDRLILNLLPFFIKLFSRRFKKYQWFFLFSISWSRSLKCNFILNFYDPEYTKEEIDQILDLETSCKLKKTQTKIICTTNYTKNYLIENGSKSRIFVLPQGHGNYNSDLHAKKYFPKKLKLVYASPYIDIAGDTHAGHINWDATVLLKEIWGSKNLHKNLELHLIGKLGENAKSLTKNSNIILHGLVTIQKCTKILQNCDVGLYPRISDNKRQAQKIVEYLGAGLPIIGFRSIDAKLVEDENIGILVDSVEEFIRTINLFDTDRDKLFKFAENALQKSNEYSWKNLAKKMDSIINA